MTHRTNAPRHDVASSNGSGDVHPATPAGTWLERARALDAATKAESDTRPPALELGHGNVFRAMPDGGIESRTEVALDVDDVYRLRDWLNRHWPDSAGAVERVS